MSGALEYAQARMQARYGARPAESAWIALHAAITPAAALECARAGALGKWVSGLDATSPLDEIELGLRERLRERIAEVASWMPSEWRSAVLWTRELLDLPALQRLAAGRPALPWMRRDPRMAARLHDASGEAIALNPRREWHDRWWRLWPASGADDRASLEEVARTVEAHVARFGRADAADAWPVRQALRARLETLFRRHALTPAAAFAYLALSTLEVERLRAEIVARAAQATAQPP
jgi:hypothetical protein